MGKVEESRDYICRPTQLSNSSWCWPWWFLESLWKDFPAWSRNFLSVPSAIEHTLCHNFGAIRKRILPDWLQCFWASLDHDIFGYLQWECIWNYLSFPGRFSKGSSVVSKVSELLSKSRCTGDRCTRRCFLVLTLWKTCLFRFDSSEERTRRKSFSVFDARCWTGFKSSASKNQSLQMKCQTKLFFYEPNFVFDFRIRSHHKIVTSHYKIHLGKKKKKTVKYLSIFDTFVTYAFCLTSLLVIEKKWNSHFLLSRNLLF